MFNIVTATRDFVWDRIVRGLTRESQNRQIPVSDFERMRYELRPGDVLLIEGRSNVSNIIKAVTQSIWTHSMLYVGKHHDIDDPEQRDLIQKFYQANPDDQLIIESLLGEGTIVDTLAKYKGENVRICRPRGLTRNDSQCVINFAINQLGVDYDVRQLLDLARFMFPYDILPRRWRSTLFEHNAGRPTQTVCSTMLAQAFAKVQFPIRPVLHQDKAGNLRLYRRKTRLITPPDFDYSPYFDVIKYPLLDLDELAVYRKLPWDRTGVYSSTAGDYFVTDASVIEFRESPSSEDDVISIVETDNDSEAEAVPINEINQKHDNNT